MLKKFIEWQYRGTQDGKAFAPLRPLVASLDAFLWERKQETVTAPHVRDAVDLKRWMMTVIFALTPCILFAIWSSGLQKFVYASGDYALMNQYLSSLDSWSAYWSFVSQDGRIFEILKLGAMAFIPVVIISYTAGGIVEMAFAIWRGHELAEGFLVTAMLYPLVLPPTIPYWMLAVGVAVGTFLSKEVFGGTGMNIMNPALTSRAFLFFTFPGRMSGDVWVGTNPTVVRQSLAKMNQEAHVSGIDGYSQATHLMQLNVSHDIKRIHIDAIHAQHTGSASGSLEAMASPWNDGAGFVSMTQQQVQAFVTSPIAEGGLGLSPGLYENAYHLSNLNYGVGPGNSALDFFLGSDKLGCFGETSTLMVLLGALILIMTRVGSWKTMCAVVVGVLGMAGLLNLFASFGDWTPAVFAFPAYKHLLVGGLAFGLVFMATDPVSSPTTDVAKWIYGIFIGIVTVVIRLINPAYPEGAMLAILMGNVFAPLFDYYASQSSRKRVLYGS